MLARLNRWIRTATGRNAEVAAARAGERRAVVQTLRAFAQQFREVADSSALTKDRIGLPIAATALEQVAKALEG